MKIYGVDDLNRNLLRKSTVAILGFGNQGHAHALNLRDSGVITVVGTRKGGRGWEQAAKAGFDSVGIAEAAAAADAVVVLLPDEVQGDVFRKEIGPALKPGSTIVFPHGFAIAFGIVKPPAGHDVVLVAPKAQGHFLRKMFTASQGVPCLVAVEQDASGDAIQNALSYASLIGCLSAGAIETTFRASEQPGQQSGEARAQTHALAHARHLDPHHALTSRRAGCSCSRMGRLISAAAKASTMAIHQTTW